MTSSQPARVQDKVNKQKLTTIQQLVANNLENQYWLTNYYYYTTTTVILIKDFLEESTNLAEENHHVLDDVQQ